MTFACPQRSLDMLSRALAVPLLAAALLATTAGAAGADTLVTPAPGARNLTANGGYLVWAAPSGGWVVRPGGGGGRPGVRR